MNNDKDDILIKAFRKRLKDYELPVDSDIWDSIEKDMKKDSHTSGKKLFWRYAGIAASLLLVLSLGLFFTHTPTSSLKETVLTENKTEIQDTNPSEKADYQEISPIDKKSVKRDIQQKTLLASVTPDDKKSKNEQKTTINDLNVHPVTDPTTPAITGGGESQQPVIPVGTENKKQEVDNQTKKQQFAQLSDPAPDLWVHSSKKRKKDNKISFALAYMTSGISEFPSSSTAEFSEKYNDVKSGSGYINEYFSDITQISYADAAAIKPTYNYKFPVSIGVAVRKNLTERLAVESGLTYTYLSSEETLKGLNTPISTKDIELSYIGIPLKMAYSIYQNNRLSIYVSGGGMVEKSISGSESFSSWNQSSTNDLNVSELQWSVSGGLGINLRLVQHLGIFVEPGVNYYFDDHSDVMTIRKDSPFNFSLLGGIRLSY